MRLARLVGFSWVPLWGPTTNSGSHPRPWSTQIDRMMPSGPGKGEVDAGTKAKNLNPNATGL